MEFNISLMCKLGSIVVHAQEATDSNGHSFDLIALETLLYDPEVVQWLKDMGPLVPQKR